MAYSTYTTKAVVCGSKSSHTSDRSYLLFTEEAGMLWATARAVREEKSKQRYALQDFSVIRVSLVRGKSGWRIGSVEALWNPFMRADNQPTRAGVASIVQLIRRLVHGEESNRAAFADVLQALEAVLEAPESKVVLVTDFFALRLLWHLGYIAEQASYEMLLQNEDWWQDPTELPSEAARAVARGLEESHL